MGALLIKADCTGCFNGGKQCRVSPLVVIDKTSPPERRLSEEIIKELKTCGILTSNTATARGGLAFDIMPDGIVQTRKPKRLQLYNQIVTKSTPEEHKLALLEERESKKAEIKRKEVLNGKGKMGREYEKKRMEVLQRKEDKIKNKVRRTEEKLKKRTLELKK